MSIPKLYTPRQKEFLKAFHDKRSPTYSDAKASALQVGYTEAQAAKIARGESLWTLLENTPPKDDIIRMAEANLREILTTNHIDQEGRVEGNVLRVKSDLTKFALERLDRENYATRQEVTGKDGAPIGNIAINFVMNKKEDEMLAETQPTLIEAHGPEHND